MRDSQRSKLYAAERRAFGLGSEAPKFGKTFTSLDDVDIYLTKLIDSAWFQRRWAWRPVEWRGPVYAGDLPGKYIRLSDGRGCRMARGGGRHLILPRWARKEWVVLHELAHCLTSSSTGGAHGWGFCKVYLELITHCIGKEAGAALKAEFKAGKVKHRQPIKRNLTEEQREALRQRVALARAARTAACSE